MRSHVTRSRRPSKPEIPVGRRSRIGTTTPSTNVSATMKFAFDDTGSITCPPSSRCDGRCYGWHCAPCALAPVLPRAASTSRRTQPWCRLPERQLRGLAFWRDSYDPPSEPAALKASDQPTAGVDLESVEAVERRRGKGVMVVVPGLAEGQPREPPNL